MQIEAFLILNQGQNILFSMHNLSPPKTWDTYKKWISDLIPKEVNPARPFYVFSDVHVGYKQLGNLSIIITAPPESLICEESSFSLVFEQFSSILSICCNNNVCEEEICKRDSFIKLQMIFQQELTPQGFLRMSSIPDLVSYSSF